MASKREMTTPQITTVQEADRKEGLLQKLGRGSRKVGAAFVVAAFSVVLGAVIGAVALVSAMTPLTPAQAAAKAAATYQERFAEAAELLEIYPEELQVRLGKPDKIEGELEKLAEVQEKVVENSKALAMGLNILPPPKESRWYNPWSW